MSYFERFKKEFFDKLINSGTSYDNVVECFNAAAKEILAVKKKQEMEGQTQGAEKHKVVREKVVRDNGGAMTPQQIANSPKLSQRGGVGTCWSCSDGSDLSPGDHCALCGRNK